MTVMGMPSLSTAQIAQISALVARYIREQSERFVGRAAGIAPNLRVPVNGFFQHDHLAATSVVVLQNERVDKPDFYSMLEDLGFRNLPDFQAMAAITFNNIIVSHGPFNAQVLFHELVHAEQYRQLGVDEFARLYVNGFLSAGSYEAIPLELNAYGLEGRFTVAPHRRFSVEEDEALWIRERRF
jgi:hypothetical protein